MYRYIVYPDELLHYGVKGMKWGVRRYQNYDGTRIGTGGQPVLNKGKKVTKAYRNSVAGGQGGKATGTARLAAKAPNPLLHPTVKQGKGKDNITPAEKIAKETRNASESSKKLVEVAERHDPKLKEKKSTAERSQAQKAKKMSDKELRDSINRIKMEREYVSLTTKEISSGYDKAKEVLSVVGDVAGVVLALVSIYATIKSVKKLKQSGIDDSDEKALMHSMLEDGDYDDEFISHAIALDDEYVADYIDDFLEHHGVKGMKWGVRRYQNYDGTRIGVGSGAGGGGGGSSKKASLSSRFKKSIAGGQGGKAEGTARLAAKAPRYSSLSQTINANRIKNGKSYLVRDKIPRRHIRDIKKKWEAEHQALVDGHEDWIALDNYMLKYERKALNWAEKDLKKNKPDLYNKILNESKGDISNSRTLREHAKQYTIIEPYKPPITEKTKAIDKAHKEYEKALTDYTNRLIGTHGNEAVSDLYQKYNGNYRDTVTYITKSLIEMEALGYAYDRGYQYKKKEVNPWD